MKHHAAISAASLLLLVIVFLSQETYATQKLLNLDSSFGPASDESLKILLAKENALKEQIFRTEAGTHGVGNASIGPVLGQPREIELKQKGIDSPTAEVAGLERAMLKFIGEHAEDTQPITTDSSEFVSTVSEMVKALEGRIQEAKARAEEMLDAEFRKFETCSSAKATFEAAARGITEEFESTAASHYECRTQEEHLWHHQDGCTRTVSALQLSRDTVCKAFHSKGPPQAKVCEPTQDESYKEWLRRKAGDFAEEHRQALQLRQSCQDHTDWAVGNTTSCNGKASAYKIKHDQCDQLNEAMDTLSCNVGGQLKSGCADYDSCWSSATSDNLNVQSMIKTQEQTYKAEWQVLQYISCLLDGMDQGHTDNSKILACKNDTHDTSHLDIKYHKFPIRDACAAPIHYPCSPGYILKYHSVLPLHAKGVCRVCGIFTTVTTTPPFRPPAPSVAAAKADSPSAMPSDAPVYVEVEAVSDVGLVSAMCDVHSKVIGGGCVRPHDYVMMAVPDLDNQFTCAGFGSSLPSVFAARPKAFAMCAVPGKQQPTTAKRRVTNWGTVHCDAGQRIIGGGCYSSTAKFMEYNGPDGDSGWRCGGHEGVHDVYALCVIPSQAPEIVTHEQVGSGSAFCPPGEMVISGGCWAKGTTSAEHKIVGSYPEVTKTGWHCDVNSSNLLVQMWALCTTKGQKMHRPQPLLGPVLELSAPQGDLHCSMEGGFYKVQGPGSCLLTDKSGQRVTVDYTTAKFTKYKFTLKMAEGDTRDNDISPHGGFAPCNQDGSGDESGASPEFWFIDRDIDWGYGIYSGGWKHNALYNNEKEYGDAEPDNLEEKTWEIVMSWDGTHYRVHSWRVEGIPLGKYEGRLIECAYTDQHQGFTPRIWAYGSPDIIYLKNFQVFQGSSEEALALSLPPASASVVNLVISKADAVKRLKRAARSNSLEDFAEAVADAKMAQVPEQEIFEYEESLLNKYESYGSTNSSLLGS